jgi:hypothetical protein
VCALQHWLSRARIEHRYLPAVLVMPGARVPSKETSVVDNTTMVEISCYD